MKILILNWRDIRNSSSGGAEILTQEIAKYWIKKGCEVTQFSSRFPNSLPEEIVDGVRIIRAGYPDLRKLFKSVHVLAFWYYQRKFKGKFDIVIDEFHGVPFFTPWYVKEKKIVLICEVAGGLWINIFGFFFGTIGKIIEKLCLKSIYKNIHFIAISDSVKQDLIQNGVRKENISVIKMGIRIPAISRKLNKEKDPTLIFLGRISISKGIEDVLIAFKEVNATYSYAKLWLVGRGEESYVKYVTDLAKKLDIEDKVVFWGFISEEKKYNLLSRAWILIHPSKNEGWGINVIEANAVGTPCVGYNISGLKDSIQNGKTGLLTEHNTPHFLAKAVIRLIKDKELYRSISSNSIKWSKNFFWEEAGKKSLSIIKKIYEQ